MRPLWLYSVAQSQPARRRLRIDPEPPAWLAPLLIAIVGAAALLSLMYLLRFVAKVVLS